MPEKGPFLNWFAAFESVSTTQLLKLSEMKMRSRLVICIAAVLCASGLFVPSARGLIIDDFLGDGEAVATVVGPTVSTPIESNSAIGGKRTLSSTKTALAGDTTARLSLETYGGNLRRNQDSRAMGNSEVFWNKGAAINPFAGLGKLDLTQDGATKIILDEIFFDFAFDKSLTIKITLYDASDPVLGRKSSTHSFTFSEDMWDREKVIPFSEFNVPGDAGAADLTNIGAISMKILGDDSPSADLEIGQIRTDGKCELYLPDNNMKVIDDCGICVGETGYNTSRDDCGKCFGNNQDKDECNLCPDDQGYKTSMDDCGDCFGNNRALDDCGICDGNNKSKDLCGICGGDNSSCTDCFGIPNGTAKYDVCGICAGDGTSCADCKGTPYGVAAYDRCGVCEGDGTSCVKCTVEDLTDLLKKLAAKSTEQRKNALFYILRVVDSDPKFAKSSKAKAKKLYTLLRELVNGLPVQVKECEETPFCTKVTSHISIVNKYSKTSKKLWQLSLKILTRQIKQGPGKCTGSAAECIQRVTARKKNTASLKTQNRRLYLQNITLIRRIPKVISVCED